MGKTRLEAFSDGVMAIIITIMVLEMKVPHEPTFDALQPIIPVFLSYVLSFVYVGIYWNNHHHMLHACTRVTGPVLWANLHLLFWLSLSPFAADRRIERTLAHGTARATQGLAMIGCSRPRRMPVSPANHGRTVRCSRPTAIAAR